MEAFVENLVIMMPLPLLFMTIALTLYTLSKGADLLVNEAIVLSRQLGIPKTVIGATIISLGTTLPETSVSVIAALGGNSELAVGNAIGSIICNTALILGIASIISPLPLQKEIANRHGWIQFGSGILLVLSAISYSSIGDIFTKGGYISRFEGFIFVALLISYLYFSIKWAKSLKDECAITLENDKDENNITVFLKLALGIAIVIISSKILIPAVQETALRLNVPNSVIAATLVAFGTSLPELVTSITATIKGHGELAIGNVIGANILNVLFVTGTSAAFSNNGIFVTPNFFTLYFPAMLFALIIFRIGTLYSKDYLKRPLGFILLGTYIFISLLSYL